MCKYSDGKGYKCPYENLEDNDYCIFHLQDDNKDVDEFNKRITEILEKEEDFINFKGFYFPPKTADFSKKQFSKNVSFSNATLPVQTYFLETTFLKKVDFNNAVFSGDADFFGVTFSDEVIFFKTTFLSDVYFSTAKFLDEVYFSEAIFKKSALFREAIFEKKASIRDAFFSELINFHKAEFQDEVSFMDTVFSGETDFDEAVFSKEAYFNKAVFSGETYFKEVIFSKKVDFYRTKITGKFIFVSNKNEIISFIDADFSGNIRITGDLSRSYFNNSNVDRVDLTDSIWIRNEEPNFIFPALYKWLSNKWGKSNTSIIIWEECQSTIYSNWKELEGIYRRLKQSYQKFGDNSTAGKFYYQEMECKRKQLKGFENHIWYIFYKKLCGYGEKPENVIFASLFLIILFAFSYLFGGIEFVGSSILKVPPNVIDYNLSLNSFGFQWAISNIDSIYEDFKLCLYTSIITFTTLGYGDVRPIGLSRIFASLEAGFGIIMTALFIFVFTRKMLR